MTADKATSAGQELARLAALVWSIPAGRRGALVQHVAACRPEDTLEEAFAVGPLRAAFAAFWEQWFGAAMPATRLRAVLAPSVPIRTVFELRDCAWHSRATRWRSS